MNRLLSSLVPCVVFVFACGGTTPPDSATDPVLDDSNGAGCEGYALGDACITEDNLAQCQEMAAACPGQVLVLESCPLQFACP